MSKEMYEKLCAPFPEEALQADRSRGSREFTSVKAQYISERLNQVFGIDGWYVEPQFSETEDGVLCLGKLHYKVGDIWLYRTGVGFAKYSSENLGDTYKGAMTDSRSKAASELGVANDVFKGKVPVPKDVPKDNHEEKEVKKERKPRSQKQEHIEEGKEEEKKVTTRNPKDLINAVLGKNKERKEDND